MCDDSRLPPICGIILYGKKEFSRFLIGFISPPDASLQKLQKEEQCLPLVPHYRLILSRWLCTCLAAFRLYCLDAIYGAMTLLFSCE